MRACNGGMVEIMGKRYNWGVVHGRYIVWAMELIDGRYRTTLRASAPTLEAATVAFQLKLIFGE